METLPYLLQLLKSNVLIYTILTTGSFSHIDLEKTENIDIWSDRAIELKNFDLSENEQFNSVEISFTTLGTYVNFQTDNPKYFNNTKYYFDVNTTMKVHNPYQIDGKEVNHSSKDMGTFEQFDPPITIWLFKSSIYNYSITVKVPDNKGMEELMKDIKQ